MSTTNEAPPRERLLSLDLFRGITIAGMVLVNNAGDWQSIYPPLRHAEWHGWTPTDLVFPFFLLIVGISIPIALEKRRSAGGTMSDLYLKIARRTLLIFAIGLFLNWFPPTSDPLGRLLNIRIPGVLQRIAICYGVAAILYLRLGRSALWRLSAILLTGYWLLLKLVPAPGFSAGDLTREGSLPSWVDRTLLPGHIYRPEYDPEGILSTIPAIVTALIGVLAGQWLREKLDGKERVGGLFTAGVLLLLTGDTWNRIFPINKALWTSSYVLFTAGLGLLLFALCYWLVDLRGVRRWAWPFVIFGVNALALFILSGMMADILTEIHLSLPDGTTETLRSFLYRRLFTSWLDPLNASLAYAVSYVLFWWGVMLVLYRRKIFLRV
jgi:predicted acyltransferase